jgi:hypothetical protein
MKIFELLKIVSDCFNKLNIPYIVTGSVASMAYGEARFTNDIDAVAEINNKHIPGILQCFPENVIIKKMEFYKMGGSDKHLRDITGILKTSESLIDFRYIEEGDKKLFLEDIMENDKKPLRFV